MLRLPHVKLSHCFKEANFCADVLAKPRSASANLSSVFVFPSSVILQPLYDDMMGVCRSRLCITDASTSVLQLLIFPCFYPKKKKKTIIKAYILMPSIH